MKKGQRIGYRRGKHAQRKGRNAEFEIRNILLAAGYESSTRGMYSEHDVNWGEHQCEVKRRRDGMRWAYIPLLAGNRAVFFRADNKPWLIIQLLADYIQDNGPQLGTDGGNDADGSHHQSDAESGNFGRKNSEDDRDDGVRRRGSEEGLQCREAAPISGSALPK